MRIQAPRGTEDVLPSQSHCWLWIEEQFRKLTALYGYRELRTPTFEETELFARTAGETSDIVTKEMYSFVDKGDRNVTLKPEGTAPAIRAVIEHNLCPPGSIVRMSYVTPIFRYGRPQKGRLREAHQFGLEIVGSSNVSADAEIIEVTSRFYEQIGIDCVVHLNSIGRAECRSTYAAAILAHLEPYLSIKPPELIVRAQKNPLGLLDSKDSELKEALVGVPSIHDYLEPDSKLRFEELQRKLTMAGVRFEVAPEIVRGLDYYTETVFEVLSDKLGAQSSLCGGGRYDNLVAELGGKPTPSVGVGMGVERALLVLEAINKLPVEPKIDIFVVSAGDQAVDSAHEIARDLRKAGYVSLVDLDARSLKSQLGQADKSGAAFAVVIGTSELENGTVQLRELSTSRQQEVKRSELLTHLRSSG